MNIDWKLIKEKYPKSYNKIISWINSKYPNKSIKNICYCNYESFFDENGIIITIWHRTETNIKMEKELFFSYYINNIDTIIETGNRYCITRDIVKEQAIYKAFSIMEGSL